jgi:hypothetical protein
MPFVAWIASAPLSLWERYSLFLQPFGSFLLPAAAGGQKGATGAIAWGRHRRNGLLKASLLAFFGALLLAGLPAHARGQAPQWAWVGGSGSSVPAANVAVYGTLGVPASKNIPGDRFSGSSWTDSLGNLWLFGGWGSASDGTGGYLNDLWEFNASTQEWTWVGGSNTVPISDVTLGQPGVYGTLGVPALGNVPGGRYSAVSWTDGSGNLWLFGDYGQDSTGTFGYLNDMWKFSPSSGEWTWVSGSTTVPNPDDTGNGGQPGVYGTLNTPATGTVPGGRGSPVSWADGCGNFWLFGGPGLDSDAHGSRRPGRDDAGKLSAGAPPRVLRCAYTALLKRTLQQVLIASG